MVPAVAAGRFDILADGVTLLGSFQPHALVAPGAREVLEELPVYHRQNHRPASLEASPVTGTTIAADKAHHQFAASSDANSIKAKLAWRGLRNRRPPIESETFEPLDAVLEESSSLIETEASLSASSPKASAAESHDGKPQKGHPLTALYADCNIEEQVGKHLAGQFEWLLTYPIPASSAENRAPHDIGSPGSASESVVYGCSYLRRNQRWSSAKQNKIGDQSTDSYAFLATPLRADVYMLSEMDRSRDAGAMTSSQPPPPYLGTPLKVPEVVTMVDRALSPSLSVVSERSDIICAAPFSVPRIEDSLEELDKLEEELEAVDAAANSRGIASMDHRLAEPEPMTPSDQKTPMVLKRASMAGQSATVRMKPTEKIRPTVRRYASLALRDKTAERPDAAAEQKAAGALPRGKPATLRAATPRSAAKSTKPPTVPNFELPGDAVARRLKEQRDARQAQQAEAQKALASPSKPKVSRPLPKPTFELPGEVISRRKREEREAKLRAEEEEDRKRREFKARPVRHSIGPTTLPRETVASRARQNRASQDEPEGKQPEADKGKRVPVRFARPTAAGPSGGSSNSNSSDSKSPQGRGRNSTAVPAMDTVSRATSASTGTSGKRSTLSAEELEQQRQRGREIFARDGVYAKDRERDRRERESTARVAREQAAERSRIASREWAEKKRRKELAANKVPQNAVGEAATEA